MLIRMNLIPGESPKGLGEVSTYMVERAAFEVAETGAVGWEPLAFIHHRASCPMGSSSYRHVAVYACGCVLEDTQAPYPSSRSEGRLYRYCCEEQEHASDPVWEREFPYGDLVYLYPAAWAYRPEVLWSEDDEEGCEE